MKIQKINFLPHYSINSKPTNNKTPEEQHPQIKSYNPPAYRDFNINFTARLFRTPENFYAQPFNQNGMPVTMKEYLYDDFDDRKKMPPAQMFKLVFSDIKQTDSLDDVKKLYPEESLFKALTNTPNKKARTGVIAEMELMSEEGKTLFKNGKNNLGLYLLKKIYTEGKTLKEINTDFQKDISAHYKGISPIQYSTLDAYGIQYPDIAFWKSFTATREEFPYEYKPRKTITSRTTSGKETGKSPEQREKPNKKGKFDNVKQWEIEKLADALIKGNGSQKETAKQIKKHNVSNKETLNFVSQYMGEINSVVLERLHISPDMKDFFENYEDLNKNQRQKFEEYMKNSYINELRSMVMKSTIEFFFETYGTDGDNEEFQSLLKYAHDIKPNRIKAQQLHDEKQAYYDEVFANYNVPQEESAEIKTKVKTDIEDEDVINKSDKFQNILEDIKAQYNVDIYDFDTKEGKVRIVSNLKEAIGESVQNNYQYMPSAFLNNYKKFVQNHPSVTDSYILTTLLQDKKITLPEDEKLMSKDEAQEVTLNLYQEFSHKFPMENRAAQQAIVDTVLKLTNDELAPKLFSLGIFEFFELCNQLPEVKDYLNNNSQHINRAYAEYKKPLNDSDARKITISAINLLRKYDESKTIIKDLSPFLGFENVFKAISIMLGNKSESKENLKKNLTKYVKEYGSSAKFLLDKEIPETLKMAKLEQLLCSYIYDKPGMIFIYIAFDNDAMEYLKWNNPKIYNYLKNEVLMNLPFLINKK